MFLPLCDNFWQAQASVMITPRLPLYIVELYAAVLYSCSTAARRFKLSYPAETALCGLLAHLLYHTYDINGPRFLWWTWHDDDAAISKRQQTVPVGSSLWILTYCGLHSALNRYVNDLRAPKLHDFVTSNLSSTLEMFLRQLFDTKYNWVNGLFRKAEQLADRVDHLQSWLVNKPSLAKIGFVGSVCTPLFMLMMGKFQILALDVLGIPGMRTYRVTLLAYLLVLLREYRNNPTALYVVLQLACLSVTDASFQSSNSGQCIHSEDQLALVSCGGHLLRRADKCGHVWKARVSCEHRLSSTGEQPIAKGKGHYGISSGRQSKPLYGAGVPFQG